MFFFLHLDCPCATGSVVQPRFPVPKHRSWQIPWCAALKTQKPTKRQSPGKEEEKEGCRFRDVGRSMPGFYRLA